MTASAPVTLSTWAERSWTIRWYVLGPGAPRKPRAGALRLVPLAQAVHLDVGREADVGPSRLRER
ncbi:MAG: hypothetical protein ACRDWV_10735, partial [Acidimicrobiales bacterium]